MGTLNLKRPMRSLSMSAAVILALFTLLPAVTVAQSAAPALGDVFAGQGSTGDSFAGTSSRMLTDAFANSCSRSNTSPFAGMNPLTCKGVQQPVDSRGRCSLQGVQLLQQIGSTCYYCQRITPALNAVVVPLDQITTVGYQGFRCGVDQASPSCYAVCSGNGIPKLAPSTPTRPPTRARPAGDCTAPDDLSSAQRAAWYQYYVRSGRLRCSGGYNPCDNPDRPSWCVISADDRRPSGHFTPLPATQTTETTELCGRRDESSMPHVEVARWLGLSSGLNAKYQAAATQLAQLEQKEDAISQEWNAELLKSNYAAGERYQSQLNSLFEQEDQIRNFTVSDVGIDRTGAYVFQMMFKRNQCAPEAWQMAARGLQSDTFLVRSYGQGLRAGMAQYFKPGFSGTELHEATQVVIAR